MRVAWPAWQDQLISVVDPEQVADLAEHAHVYMTKDGRISMAGLNEHNVHVRLVNSMF